MKKYLIGLLLSSFAATGFAASTKFTNLTVSGTSSLGGAVSVSTQTVSGSQGLRFTGGFITPASDVPAAAGILAFASSYVLYVSTGTGAAAWVKVGGQ